NLLRAGTPIWQLYADPDLPPYAVVNYPPVYHLLTALVALPLGNALLAGRLVSLAATLAATLALWMLVRDPRREQRTKNIEQRLRAENREPRTENREPRTENRELSNQEPTIAANNRFLVLSSQFLVVLAFLALPIVREWAV